MLKRIRLSLALTAATVLLLTAGCGGGSNTITADETSDPVYEQAQDFKRQGRNSEALAAFLKVIDRRGESGAPESHLEAGLLYRSLVKDPVEAYHHFNKYLELMPNSPKSDMVRGQRDAAYRDIARFLQAPSSGTMLQMQTNEEIDQLKRRIRELEAENQMLHGSGGGVVAASPRPPPLISLSEDKPLAPPAETTNDSPITPAPTAATGGRTANGGNLFNGPSMGSSSSARPTTNPPSRAANSTTVASRPVPPVAQRVTATPQRPGAGTHTVKSTDKSLWAIARQHYGKSATAAQVAAIFQANRDVMRSESDLKVGMVLRIP